MSAYPPLDIEALCRDIERETAEALAYLRPFDAASPLNNYGISPLSHLAGTVLRARDYFDALTEIARYSRPGNEDPARLRGAKKRAENALEFLVPPEHSRTRMV